LTKTCFGRRYKNASFLGAYLYDNEVDPYQGDVFHENPLVLVGAHFLFKNFNSFIPMVLIVLDLLTSVLVYYGARGITKKNVICLGIIADISANFF
jgi:hypothetical protein